MPSVNNSVYFTEKDVFLLALENFLGKTCKVMKRKAQMQWVVHLFVLVFGLDCVWAQSATPLSITAGLNVDLVADGSGSAGGSVSGGFDNAGSVFYASSYLSSHPGGSSGVLPSGGTVVGNSGNQYYLAPAAGANALLLTSGNTSGTLNLFYSTPAQLKTVYVLGSSADGPTLLNYTLNFSGGATVSGSFTFSDWYDPGLTGEITGLSHVSTADVYSGQGNVFSLYDKAIVIPDADVPLTLQSISFTFEGSTSKAAIFDVSGAAPVPVPEPTSAALLSVGLAAAWFARRRGSLRG
jgi:hypothetical protein